MMMNSYLQIDLQALRDNVETLRKELGPGVKLIPVIKGDAYGLGAVRLAQALNEMGGIDTFAVSQVAEGIALRQAGIKQQILVMSLPLDSQTEAAVEQNLTLTLGSFRQFPLFRSLAQKLQRQIPVSLKLDSGLHRIGFLPEELDPLIDALKASERELTVTDTFSHFSDATEEGMKQQGERFRQVLEKLRAGGIDPGFCHISSSAAIETSRDYMFDAVRIGRALMLDHPMANSGRIREVASLRCFLADIRERQAGETLGYENGIHIEKATRVGILSMGYGDGLDPALALAGAPVLIRGQRAKFLGCCMDQSFVDLDALDCAVGDPVTLFGYDEDGGFLSAQEVAARIGCEGCDLTVRLTNRVERVYL